MQTDSRTSRMLCIFCKPIPELRASLCNFANRFPNFAQASAILQSVSRTSRKPLQFCKAIPELRASLCNFAKRSPNFGNRFALNSLFSLSVYRLSSFVQPSNCRIIRLSNDQTDSRTSRKPLSLLKPIPELRVSL